MNGESILTRMRALEKIVGRADSERRAYSHSQLVQMATCVREGKSEEEIADLVGPPEDVLQPGEKSHMELILETERRPPPEPSPRSCLVSEPAGKE